MTTIGEVSYKLSLETKDFDSGVDKAQSKFQNVGSKLGSVAATAGKTIAAGLAAGAAGAAALTAASVKAYADYEQLTGGVETLFKDSASQVMQYADAAYQTAGLSANAYMETVTSFSASLLQSLGGDTAESARIADMAVTDMADNANKMGTSIESIQNAYQGFAKQNYTMLDNLKLGYGGTATEMARLINDSGVMGDKVITAANLSEVGFATMTQAIHKVQEEMGITGTTALEASETISGSLASMKASWTNLITGLGDDNADFGGLIDKFVSSVATAAKNLIPRIKSILKGIVGLIKELVPVIAEALPGLIQDLLPPLIDAAISIVIALVEALPQILPPLIDGIVNAIPLLIDALVKAIPHIVQGLITVVTLLVPRIPEIIGMLLKGIVDAFFALVGMIGPVFEGLVTALAGFLQGIFKFWTDVFGAIADWTYNHMIKPVIDIFSGLFSVISGIASNIGKAFSGMFDGVKRALQGVRDFFVNIFNAIGNIVKAPINGIIRGINGVLRTINSIKIPDWVPVIGGAHTNFGMIPQLATGGIVQSTPGGQIIRAGEAGEDEWVVPESKMASMIEQLANQGVGGNTINITVSGVFATSPEEQRRVAEQIAGRLEELNIARMGA